MEKYHLTQQGAIVPTARRHTQIITEICADQDAWDQSKKFLAKLTILPTKRKAKRS